MLSDQKRVHLKTEINCSKSCKTNEHHLETEVKICQKLRAQSLDFLLGRSTNLWTLDVETRTGFARSMKQHLRDSKIEKATFDEVWIWVMSPRGPPPADSQSVGSERCVAPTIKHCRVAEWRPLSHPTPSHIMAGSVLREPWPVPPYDCLSRVLFNEHESSLAV